MKKQKVEQRFMDVHDAASYLGASEKSIRYAIEARRLPFTRIGYRIRFDRRELDKMLAKNAVQPIPLKRR